ncbi:hypothetical protein D3C83_226390 [compost metagenome]
MLRPTRSLPVGVNSVMVALDGAFIVVAFVIEISDERVTLRQNINETPSPLG